MRRFGSEWSGVEFNVVKVFALPAPLIGRRLRDRSKISASRRENRSQSECVQGSLRTEHFGHRDSKAAIGRYERGSWPYCKGRSPGVFGSTNEVHRAQPGPNRGSAALEPVGTGRNRWSRSLRQVGGLPPSVDYDKLTGAETMEK